MFKINKIIEKLNIIFHRRFWSLVRKLFLLRLKFSKNKRPSNYPYISGDSYMNIADHVFDENNDFDPGDVKTGDVIFVSNPRTEEFLRTKDRLIKNRYILIEHNGDRPIDKEIADLLSNNIYKFYAQDVIYRHEKIVPIPIGYENLWIHVNCIPWILKNAKRKVEKKGFIKKNKIFFNFSIGTNPAERGPAHKYFSSHPNMETLSSFVPSKIHFDILSQYKFVASPPGNAIESCRTWEALLVRTIPIVKDFESYLHFKKIGVPMWVVKDWKELDNLSEDDIARKYDELIEGANWAPLYMDYWIDLINKDKEALCR